jgi:TolB-like protein/Flp pilus assembly protein TadD
MTDISDRLRSELAGRYTIERELGRGGMATVFLAHDLRHDRPVALKVMHPDLAHALGPERFLREIRLAARLQHPHVLSVLDSGEDAGHLWFTMPYVRGDTLRDRLRRERQLPVDDALRVTREAALALQHAHEEGVIHRDIKPDNILLTRDGSTLVADFGIARALVAGEEAPLTQTGMAVGTPAYMSPEQASGERGLDARTDVYSLAAVLYELLAGEPPYTGPTAQVITAKRLSDPVPSVRRIRTSVPEHVDRALQRALSPAAADRFGSASAFARALEAPLASVAPHVSVASSSRSRALVAMLVLAAAIALGVLYASRRPRPEAASSADSAKRVAVLPFENLGDSGDAYFADGLTDAVRGKLAAVPGLEVIASTSANQYRGTTKAPRQIAGELGVRYLLVGRVRWDKSQGTSRIEVSPELIELASAGAPTTRWQQPFNAALTDVFSVQSDIASQVVSALDIVLAEGTRSQLAARPTASLAAYDAYLKGQEAERRFGMVAAGHSAQAHYEQAVGLDSSFALAWARLSQVRSSLYGSGFADTATARFAREAAERAVALAPASADGYEALAVFHDAVTNDSRSAREAALTALRLAPGNADALHWLALAEQAMGRWEASVQLLERASVLDPRSVQTLSRLGRTLLAMRRYPEALASFDRALAIEPSDLVTIELRAMVHLAMGDLEAARALLREPPPGVSPERFVALIATYWDLGWALSDEQQRLLLRLDARPFDGDVASWGLALAQVAALRGDTRLVRIAADSARAALEQQTAQAPDDPQSHSALGVALVYLGRRTEAVRAGERGRDLLPISRDAEDGPYQQHQLARIHVLLGEPERALDQLEPLLRIPYYLSPGWLRVDPTFAPLRGNPRFERLAGGS